MLSYELLKNHAGLLIVGDYTTLKLLHAILHDVHDRSPMISGIEDQFLCLAYDVRKAYEGQRKILKPKPPNYEGYGVRYGFQIIWPRILFEQRMLRKALGYMDHSRGHQAITYELEAVIEVGLREAFGPQSEHLEALWQRLDPNPTTSKELYSRSAIFCSWTKAERKLRLAELLNSLDLLYEFTHERRVRNGERGLLSPDDFAYWEDRDCPEPRW